MKSVQKFKERKRTRLGAHALSMCRWARGSERNVRKAGRALRQRLDRAAQHNSVARTTVDSGIGSAMPLASRATKHAQDGRAATPLMDKCAPSRAIGQRTAAGWSAAGPREREYRSRRPELLRADGWCAE